MKHKFQRSDIPYKDRLLMQKHQSIAAHRDEAARVALQVACVALNDTEGLGYQRLSRFARRLQELIREYYEDTDVGDAHLKTRLEQLGFIVENGHMFAVENSGGDIVPKKLLEE
jgi:DNA-binding PadR family transcriptional regulator